MSTEEDAAGAAAAPERSRGVRGRDFMEIRPGSQEIGGRKFVPGHVAAGPPAAGFRAAAELSQSGELRLTER